MDDANKTFLRHNALIHDILGICYVSTLGKQIKVNQDNEVQKYTEK